MSEQLQQSLKCKQIYKIGDCLELMKEIPDKSIDLVLTDLPYGITDCEWDIKISLLLLWDNYNRIIKDNGVVALCSTQPFTTEIIQRNRKNFKYCWYWLKEKGTSFANSNSMPLKIIEEICIFYKKQPIYIPQKEPLRHKYVRVPTGSETLSKTNKMTSTKHIGKTIIRTHKTPTNLLCYSRESQNGSGSHPTQKPLELFKYIIKTYTNECDTVLDSCLGSGTTLVACRETNRNGIGFEINPDYEPIIKKRLMADIPPLEAFF